jgi:hypothetical protein
MFEIIGKTIKKQKSKPGKIFRKGNPRLMEILSK